MFTRRLLIALCVALAGLGALAPSHTLADDPVAGPSQVQAPAGAKSSLISYQGPAAALTGASGVATAATIAPSAETAASPAPTTASAPAGAGAATTAGVSGTAPVVIGPVATQPLSVAPAASSGPRTPAVLMPPPIPSFPALSPATTGAVTARGEVPVVLAANNLNEVSAPAGGTNAPFSAVLGISATRPEAARAVPATIISQSSAAATAVSPSQAVAQAPAAAPSQAVAKAAVAAPSRTVTQAPAAAAQAPKGPYAVQAPQGAFAAAPKGPYAAQKPGVATYAGGNVSAPAPVYPVAAAASVPVATQTQLAALPQLPNTGTGGLLDLPAPPPQTPGILAGLLLAGLLGVAAALSPSRRAHPAPPARRTSSGRIYWLNESLR